MDSVHSSGAESHQQDQYDFEMKVVWVLDQLELELAPEQVVVVVEELVRPVVAVVVVQLVAVEVLVARLEPVRELEPQQEPVLVQPAQQVWVVLVLVVEELEQPKQQSL